MKQILLTCLLVIFTFSSLYSQTFTKSTINSATGANPYVLDSGLLDDNVYPDIAIGTDGGNTVEVYLNTTGTFPTGAGVTLTATAPNNDLLYVEGIHIADINEDGANDILATGYGNDRVVWFQGNLDGMSNPDGTFQDAVALLDNIDGAGTVITGNLHEDLNAPVDNNLDLVVVANGPDGNTDSVIFLLGNGDGTFGTIQYIAPQTTGSGAGDVDLADFDGDGDMDAVIAFTGNGDVYLYDNNFIPSGTVSFTRYTNPVSTGNGFLFDISFADLDDNGSLDIIKSDNSPGGGNPGIVWYTNDTNNDINTTFTNHDVTTSIGGPARAAVADFDVLDMIDNNDLIVTNGGVTDLDVIMFNSVDLTTEIPWNDNTQSAVYDININDFDGDGDLDFASVSYFQNDLNIFLNDEIPTLSVDDITIQEISIFPNPTKNTLNFKGPFTGDFNVSVYNILGKQVMSSKIEFNSSLDVTKLHSGVYIIKFEDFNSTFKFIKE